MKAAFTFFTLLAAGHIAAPAAAAQAAPAEAAHSQWYLRAEDHRVLETGYRLAARGASLCAQHHPLTGMLLHHLAEYDAKDRALMISAHRLDLGPGILSVVPGSPAAEAGLRAGDVLVSVNGRALADPRETVAKRDREGGREAIEEVEAQVEAAFTSGAAEIGVRRADGLLSMQLAAMPACLGRVRLARSTQPNAFADGRYAIVTTKLLGFLRGDDELAVVLAHELAHNILGHPQRLRDQKVPRGALRHFGKNARRIWVTEEEADRLSVRLLAAAGYDLDAILPFWRRFYANYDFLPQIFRTHPSLGARERIFSEAIAQVRAAPPAPATP